MLDVQPELMPALGDAFDGLLYIRQPTFEMMESVETNMVEMLEACREHSVKGDLRRVMKEGCRLCAEW
jgi:hypothetical protein